MLVSKTNGIHAAVTARDVPMIFIFIITSRNFLQHQKNPMQDLSC